MLLVKRGAEIGGGFRGITETCKCARVVTCRVVSPPGIAFSSYRD